MPKMELTALQPMLAAQKADALSAMNAAELSTERQTAMDYYLGTCPGICPLRRRSRAVSTDVQDAVEGLMPSLMDIFAGSDEVVRFEPVVLRMNLRRNRKPTM